MSHRVTLNGKQKKAAIIIIPLSLLILVISLWPQGPSKEVRSVTPAVAKRVVLPAEMYSLGCGEGVRVVAPVATWSKEIYQRIGCDFHFLRNPLPDASSGDRRRNLHSLITARINGKGGPEMPEGHFPDGRHVNAYFEDKGYSVAFRSEEHFPIHIIVQYLPK